MTKHSTPDEELSIVIEATAAYDNLSRHVLMRHRGELTKSQMDVLIGLRYLGKMTMTEVSRHMAASKEQASRVTAPLVEMGYVVRGGNPENHRTVEVSLTQKGMEYLDSELRAVTDELKREFSAMDDQDLARLIETSEIAVSILRKNAER